MYYDGWVASGPLEHADVWFELVYRARVVIWALGVCTRDLPPPHLDRRRVAAASSAANPSIRILYIPDILRVSRYRCYNNNIIIHNIIYEYIYTHPHTHNKRPNPAEDRLHSSSLI